jgi:hypothetical protein
VAARLIETRDLVVDDELRMRWASLEPSKQNEMLFWVNAPRLARRRRQRLSQAVQALRQGETRPPRIRPDFAGGLLDLIADVLLPW